VAGRGDRVGDRRIAPSPIRSAMSPESAAAVRASWETLRPDLDALTDVFYHRLFALAPETLGLFAHVDLAEQRRKLGRMLQELVRVLDDPGALVDEVAPSGRRHVGYGARDAHYEPVGVALLQALEARLGDAFTPAVREAWRELYGLVAAVMRRAGARAVDHRASSSIITPRVIGR